MTKLRWHRRFVVLSMLAMLGSILNVPLSNSIALAMQSPSHAAQATVDEMPCHKAAVPAKPCPGCPQKACLLMGTCLGSCFQHMAPVTSGATVLIEHSAIPYVPVHADVLSGTPAPPLLRPPIV
jgi:hypothetical protein